MLTLARILRILFVLIGVLAVIVAACFASPTGSVGSAESGWKTGVAGDHCGQKMRVLDKGSLKKECKENVR